MALNPATLGVALAAAAGSVDPVGIAKWMAIAAAIVTHFQTQSVVVGVATGAMGGGPGVPVTGTIT